MRTADLQLPKTSEAEQRPSASLLNYEDLRKRDHCGKNIGRHQKTSEDIGRHRKTSEDKPQVYSTKKTCGSELEAVRKAARSVPLQVSHVKLIIQ